MYGFDDDTFYGPEHRLIEDVIRLLDLSRFPLRMRLHVRGNMLVVDMYVNDRDNGRESVVMFGQRISLLVRDARAAEQFVYSVVNQAVIHELAECYLYNGQRVHDPHAARSRG